MKRMSILLAVSMVLSLTACVNQANFMTLPVACIRESGDDSGGDALVMEDRSFPLISGETLYRFMVNELQATPTSQNLEAVLPYGIQLQEVSIDDGVVTCAFSDGLFLLSDARRMLAFAAITRTLCQLPEVSGVIIRSGNAPVHDGVLTVSDFVYSSDALRFVEYKLLLYYPNLSQTALTTALCSLRLTADKELSEAVIETLLSGPVTNTGYVINFLPEGTMVNSVTVRDTIYTVEISQEFAYENLTKADGTSLTLYALVNSLTALPHISGVKILIDGESRQTEEHPLLNQTLSFRSLTN